MVLTVKLTWNFPGGGGGGCKTENLPWGEYGYFLELHILRVMCAIYKQRDINCFSNWCIACVAVVSVSFKPSGASARGHWAKRSKKVGAGGGGGDGGGGKETPATEPRHFTRPSPPLLLFCSFLPNAVACLPCLA